MKEVIMYNIFEQRVLVDNVQDIIRRVQPAQPVLFSDDGRTAAIPLSQKHVDYPIQQFTYYSDVFGKEEYWVTFDPLLQKFIDAELQRRIDPIVDDLKLKSLAELDIKDHDYQYLSKRNNDKAKRLYEFNTDPLWRRLLKAFKGSI